MSIEWVNSAIDDLRAWGRARGVEVDADEVRLLCDYASDYLNVNKLADFTPATFDELLLSIYPRKVIAPPRRAPRRPWPPGARSSATCRSRARSATRPPPPCASGWPTSRPACPTPWPTRPTSAWPRACSAPSGPNPWSSPSPSRPVRCPIWGRRPATAPAAPRVPPSGLAAPEELEAELRGVPLLAALDRGAVPYLEGLRAPGDPLGRWAAVVAHLMEGDTGGGVTGSAGVDEELYDLFDMLYRVQAPVPAEVIGEYLEELVEDEVDVPAVLARLAWCGLVRLTGDGAHPAAGLTPAAVWALREHYLALGLDAPQAPDLAEADARGLIEGLLDGVPAELAESDIDRWLAARSPEEAAAQLFDAASGAPAVARGIAVTIADRLGAGAEPAVRGGLDDPELRPHAIHWLISRGLPAPHLTHDELLWVSVDMLALAMPHAQEAPEIFAENMGASGPPAHLIEEMWQVDHPDVVEVLELLGRSLPDTTTAKAARKAAFKARSRAIR
ncbi:hypothetical protein ACFSTC_35575 [Nonomuraea ferruginea]